MDKIIDIFKQIEVKIGLFIIVIAIVVGVFKQSWLIGGVSTMSKKEKEKIDFDYLTKYFGLFCGIFGLLMLLSPFLFDFLAIKHEHRIIVIPIAICLFCAILIWYFNDFKKNKIYKK